MQHDYTLPEPAVVKPSLVSYSREAPPVPPTVWTCALAATEATVLRSDTQAWMRGRRIRVKEFSLEEEFEGG